MPIYEYRREDGSQFETVQSINDEALEECPETGQKCKRIITGGSGTIFRGNGWPDKTRKKRETARKNPGHTSLPEYRDAIDKNTEKAKKLEQESIDKNK